MTASALKQQAAHPSREVKRRCEGLEPPPAGACASDETYRGAAACGEAPESRDVVAGSCHEAIAATSSASPVSDRSRRDPPVAAGGIQITVPDRMQLSKTVDRRRARAIQAPARQ